MGFDPNLGWGRSLLLPMMEDPVTHDGLMGYVALVLRVGWGVVDHASSSVRLRAGPGSVINVHSLWVIIDSSIEIESGPPQVPVGSVTGEPRC